MLYSKKRTKYATVFKIFLFKLFQYFLLYIIVIFAQWI